MALGGVSCANALSTSSTAAPAQRRLRTALDALALRCLAACPTLVSQHQLPLWRSDGFVLLLATRPPRGPLAACPALGSSASAYYPLRQRSGSEPPAAAVACTAAFDTPALHTWLGVLHCPLSISSPAAPAERRFQAAAFEAHAARALAARPALVPSASTTNHSGSSGGACFCFRRAHPAVLGGVSCTSVSSISCRSNGSGGFVLLLPPAGGGDIVLLLPTARSRRHRLRASGLIWPPHS